MSGEKKNFGYGINSVYRYETIPAGIGSRINYF
jgi:hypothetical protein